MDVPADAETYLHRIGRAGRYGNLLIHWGFFFHKKLNCLIGCYGTAVSLVCESEELELFENIINKYKLRINQYGANFEDIIISHNNVDEKSLIDDVKIERVQVNDDELVNSLEEYEKEREKQSRIFHSIKKKDQKVKTNRNHRVFTFSNFSSIEDVELSLSSCFAETNPIISDKYKKSIEKLDSIVQKNKSLFESKYLREKRKFKRIIEAKLNGNEINDKSSECSSIELSDESESSDSSSSSLNEIESDESDDIEDDIKERDNSKNKLFSYYYYYNYYFTFYYNYFMNLNE